MNYDTMTSEERKACLDDITVTPPKFSHKTDLDRLLREREGRCE